MEATWTALVEQGRQNVQAGRALWDATGPVALVFALLSLGGSWRTALRSWQAARWAGGKVRAAWAARRERRRVRLAAMEARQTRLLLDSLRGDLRAMLAVERERAEAGKRPPL